MTHLRYLLLSLLHWTHVLANDSVLSCGDLCGESPSCDLCGESPSCDLCESAGSPPPASSPSSPPPASSPSSPPWWWITLPPPLPSQIPCNVPDDDVDKFEYDFYDTYESCAQGNAPTEFLYQYGCMPTDKGRFKKFTVADGNMFFLYCDDDELFSPHMQLIGDENSSLAHLATDASVVVHGQRDEPRAATTSRAGAHA